MNNTIRKKFLYFLLFPFISSLTAVKNIKSQSSIMIIIGFFLIFGLSFNPVNEREDSYRYAQEFREFQHTVDRNYEQVIKNYLSGESSTENGVKDIYVYTMYYLSSKIGGNNIHILFLLFAIVFTFFCIGSLKFIINNKNFKYGWPTYILLFLFFYSNPIYNINGVRFWTASWVAIYVSFHILINNNKKWLFALLSLPLIHISFFIYIIVFGIAYVLRNRTNALFKVFIISFFLGQLGFALIDAIKAYLPPLLQTLIWSYTAEENLMNNVDQNEALYATILNALPRYYELCLLLIIGLYRKKLPKSPVIGFSLAFFSVINLLAFIPSLGVRYYIVGYPFIIYLWIDNLSYLKKSTVVLKLAPFIYAYRFFRWIRNVLLVTSPSLYYSNFFHLVIRVLIEK